MAGIYLVIDGIDGSGKTSVAAAVSDILASRGTDVLETRHPGATPVGAAIRAMMKSTGPSRPDPLVDQVLMLADHVAFVQGVLKPALAVGKTVLADRCNITSGLAYGVAMGINPDIIAAMYAPLVKIISSPKANTIFILDCPVDLAQQRLVGRRGRDQDYFDSLSRDFFTKVAEVYAAIGRPPPPLVRHQITLPAPLPAPLPAQPPDDADTKVWFTKDAAWREHHDINLAVALAGHEIGHIDATMPIREIAFEIVDKIMKLKGRYV